MFKAGDFAFSQKENHYHIIQILRVSKDYLIKDYWEGATLNIDEIEIRSWVKRVDACTLEGYELLKNEKLVERDAVELNRFLEIEQGLNNRKERTAAMHGLVQEAIQNTDFDSALELLTEWAMLEKYRSEIYLLREECLRKHGRDTEADYELHVYNT